MTTVTIVCPNLAKKVLEGESHYERVEGGHKIDYFGVPFTVNTAWDFHQNQGKKMLSQGLGRISRTPES